MQSTDVRRKRAELIRLAGYLFVMDCYDVRFVINKDMSEWYCAVSTDPEEEMCCLPLLRLCDTVIEEENEYIIAGTPCKEYARHIKEAVKKAMPIWNVNYIELRIPKNEDTMAELDPLIRICESPTDT